MTPNRTSTNRINRTISLKRHPALMPLSRDHHFGLLLCWKIRTGIHWGIITGRISNYTCHFFDQHLSNHFSKEEEVIFSLLKPNDKWRKEAERQHRRLIRLRLKLDQLPARQIITLGQIEEELEAHIRFEERNLFLYLQQQLTNEQLTEVLTKLQASHQPFVEHWNDPFWEKKE